MSIKHPYRVALAALIAAWSFDYLFWSKSPGIAFPIYIVVLASAGLALAWSEKARIPAASLWLLLPAGFFAAMTTLRLEPFTNLLNSFLALCALALLTATLLGGRWTAYSLSDYVVAPFRLMASMLARTPAFWREKRRLDQENRPAEQPARPAAWRRSAPVFRGLLLAVPVLAVFSALFAAADPIFAEGLRSIFNFSWLRNLDETLFRIAYVLLFAYAFHGLYLHALDASRDEHLIGIEKHWLPSFLGWTEAVVVLALVDLLFAFFVGLQLRYFFGGQVNITLEGFTYADYARRGFGELVVVAVFSLGLFLGLSSVTRRESSAQRRVFSLLSAGLVGLVAVILVSAFQRLTLYESAYGFTRMRTYTHIFMLWLGGLLVCAAVLEIVRRQRAFALAAVIALIGFGVSLNLLNIDTFIVRQNVARATSQGSDLDAAYLATLSGDAVAPLVAGFRDPALPKPVHNRLGVALACRTAVAPVTSTVSPDPWQSYHPAEGRARELLGGVQAELKAYRTFQDEYGILHVKVGDEVVDCFAGGEWD